MPAIPAHHDQVGIPVIRLLQDAGRGIIGPVDRLGGYAALVQVLPGLVQGDLGCLFGAAGKHHQ